jgi:hypothetical protein
MKAPTILQRVSPLTRFVLFGSVLELLYLLLFAIIPVPTSHHVLSPTGSYWPWILAPAQLLVDKTTSYGAGSTIPGINYLLLSLMLITLACFYVYVVVQAFHGSDNVSLTYRWLLVPAVGATIFGISLLFLPALFNNETDNYVVKSLALFSHIVNCALIWALLGTLAPTRRLEGTLLYAWNPLALIELAGNGHNEGFLICSLLLATLFIVRQKGRWYDFLAMVFLGFAISINFIALLFAPILIWFSGQRETKQTSMGQRSMRDISTKSLSPNRIVNQPLLILGLCWRAIVALVIVFTLNLPFWHGSSTFSTITSSFDMQQFLQSPLGIFVIPVRWLFSLLVQTLHLPTTVSSFYSQPTIAADMAVRASAMFIFVLIYFYLLGKVRSIDTLLTSLCVCALGFIVLICGQFWPWYILWALWIIALRRFDALTVSVLLLSCTALLTYPLLSVDNSSIAILQPLLIFGIPLIYLITQVKRSNERMTILNDRRSETTQN